MNDNDNRVVTDIVTAAKLYEAALGEQHHILLRRDQLTNVMLTNIDLICSYLLQFDELQAKLKDAEELIEVLENSLGEADDRIKALEQDASPKKKVKNH